MSTKGDLIYGDKLDHHSDRVYTDCSDDTINIEVHKNSPAFSYALNEREDGDDIALLSIKMGSKLGKWIMGNK